MATPVRLTLKTSGAEYQNTTHTAVELPQGKSAIVYVNVTAASGGSSGVGRRLGVYLDGRTDPAGTFYPMVTGNGTLIRSLAIATIGAGNAPYSTYGGSVIVLDSVPRTIRSRSSIGGASSPAFTYSIVIDVMQ